MSQDKNVSVLYFERRIENLIGEKIKKQKLEFHHLLDKFSRFY